MVFSRMVGFICFIRRPELFDVVVASNLFADILTDLGAVIMGGMGFAPSANLNPERTFQLRSAGKERPIELTFQTLGGGDLRRTLSDEESAALRTAIEEAKGA